MRLRCFILAMFLLAGTIRAAPADIQSLINSLGDPDPVARESAADAIKHQGAAARAALIAALRSDNPEIAAHAGAILQELPWFLPSDPPPVKEILTAYGKGDDNARFDALARLRALASAPAHDALCRLLQEEPSDAMRWAVESMLRTIKAERFRGRVRDLDTNAAADNAAMLAAVGWAWHGRDAKKSTELFRRAIDLQLAQSTEEYGEVRAVILPTLIDEATHARRFNDAADLLRKQASASSPAPMSRRGRMLDPTVVDEAVPGPVLHLMMLHAEFGPLPGFAADVRNFAPSLRDPRMLYCAGRLLSRAGFPMLGRGCDMIAAAAGSQVPQSRVMTGYFLMQRDWHAEAERELLAVMRMPAADKRVARMLLAKNAADVDDFTQAAVHLQAIPPVPGNPDETRSITGELHWRRFQAARAKNDEAAMKTELDAIVALTPISGEIAMDAVPALKKIGRVADADRLFAAAYAMFSAPPAIGGGQAADLDDPERMNNLAWLCSRSGEHLDEALKLSTQAITAEPENAAYLDTAAEANFRLGKADEAVRLETRALKFRPADAFMLGQLERFKKAPAAP